MRGHLLVIRLDDEHQARLDAGEHVFPEHPDDRAHGVVCLDLAKCNGWETCSRQHICKHGHVCSRYDELSMDGPCPGEQDNCWSGYDEFTFHGEEHVWRGSDYGWTVRYRGCVVSSFDYELDFCIDDLPIGQYEVEDDWDDEWCRLLLVEPALPGQQAG